MVCDFVCLEFSLADFAVEILELVLPKCRTIMGRAVCKRLKSKIEQLSRQTISINHFGAHHLTSRFLRRFSGSEIEFACKEPWNLESVWFHAVLEAFRGQCRIEKLCLNVDGYNLSQLFDSLLTSSTPVTRRLVIDFSGFCENLAFGLERLADLNFFEIIEFRLNLIAAGNAYISRPFATALNESLKNLSRKKVILIGLNLEIDSPDLFSSLGQEKGKIFLQGLQSHPNLESLNLAGHQLGQEGGRLIASCFPRLTRINTLNLGNNELGSEGGLCLASSLQLLPNLHTLILPGNHLGVRGGRAVLQSLRAMPALEILDLGNNDLEWEGASALAAVMPALTSLRTLRLAGNAFGLKGGNAAAAALPALHGLESLDLARNNLGPEGGRAVTAALTGLTALLLLDLWGKERAGKHFLLR
jgi:hypothetical protein